MDTLADLQELVAKEEKIRRHTMIESEVSDSGYQLIPKEVRDDMGGIDDDAEGANAADEGPQVRGCIVRTLQCLTSLCSVVLCCLFAVSVNCLLQLAALFLFASQTPAKRQGKDQWLKHRFGLIRKPVIRGRLLYNQNQTMQKKNNHQNLYAFFFCFWKLFAC